MRNRDSRDLAREWSRCQRAELTVVECVYDKQRRHWRVELKTALDRRAHAFGLTGARAMIRAYTLLGFHRRGEDLVCSDEPQRSFPLAVTA